MVDAADMSKMESAKQELHKLLSKDALVHIPVRVRMLDAEFRCDAADDSNPTSAPAFASKETRLR